MFDKNGDNKISEVELFEVMKYLGVSATENEVKAMIQVVDKNSKLFFCNSSKLRQILMGCIIFKREWMC